MNLYTLALCFASLAAPPAIARTFRFDFGTGDSPLAGGWTRVTPQTAYSARAGHGFLEAPAEASFIDKNLTSVDERFKKPWRIETGIASLNELTRDYVAGRDLKFRVDLPNGQYEVVATLGYKNAIHHVNVTANGRTVAADLSVFTYHYAYRGFREDVSIGASFRVRFRVEITTGSLVLHLSGDASKGKTSHTIRTREGSPLTFETGDRFTVASIMGLAVYPSAPYPADAWKLFQEAGDLETGWREELRLLRRAGELLSDGSSSPLAGDLREQVDLALEALRYFHERDSGNNEMGTINGFVKAHSIWRQFPPGHPFHDKGLLYTGRMFAGLFPFSPTPISEYGRELLRDVERRYPRNRYVRLYLYDEWSSSDWKFNDYPVPPGTPKWAEVARRAFCQNLDFGEYWADFRQRPNGSLGGGWNDDVEVMPIWALHWFTSPDASPKIGRMLERFTEGMWTSGNIDHRRAFSAHFSDAEHAAEDQGNSVPYLIGMLYGNPRYLNWNLRTIEYFRNYLTGINASGRRHFRSNHFDATRYAMDLGPEHATTEVEAAICYRAFGAVPWMVWYNQNPVSRRLLLEHADSWQAAAMSTAKGKPRGIVPAQVGFNDEVGGPEPSWLGKPGLGAGGEWPAYLWYLHGLLLAAHAASGDTKYLEPFQETYAFLRGHKDASGTYKEKAGAAPGSSEWVFNKLLAAQHVADGLYLARDFSGDARYDDYLMAVGRPYVRYRLTGDLRLLAEDLDSVNAQVKRRWPHMTTEGVMTDRIGYNPRVVSYMTGVIPEIGYQGFPHHAVTYSGTGREFAAVAEEASGDRLRVLYYSFADQARTVSIRPWRLTTGARYRVRAMAASGGAALHSAEILLEERGQLIPIPMPARREVRIEVFSITTPAAPAPRADLAISTHDIGWNAASDQIEATVHNVGSAEAVNFEVAFYRQDEKGSQLLEKAIVSRLGAPNDLHSENITVGTWHHRDSMIEGDTVVVQIDPDRKVAEITRSNNSASLRLALSEQEREAMITKRLTEHDQRFRIRKPKAPIERPRIRTLSNLVYGDTDPLAQRLDAYLVESVQPAPVVIEYHGGGWRTGQKSDLDQYGGFIRRLMAAGYSLISADYRLTPRHTWPAQGEDAVAVLKFVRSKAKEWNIDPNRIALIGGSAGAHLALFAGLPEGSGVRAIVDLWGPGDLSMISPRVPRGEALTALFDTTVEEYEKPGGIVASAIRDASPIHLITPKSPPVFVVHDGPADAVSPSDPRISGVNMGVHSAAFGLALAQRLKQAGVTHEILIAPSAGREFQARALEFVRRHLR
jgi:acetyl esterase/lipase